MAMQILEVKPANDFHLWAKAFGSFDVTVYMFHVLPTTLQTTHVRILVCSTVTAICTAIDQFNSAFSAACDFHLQSCAFRGTEFLLVALVSESTSKALFASIGIEMTATVCMPITSIAVLVGYTVGITNKRAIFGRLCRARLQAFKELQVGCLVCGM